MNAVCGSNGNFTSNKSNLLSLRVWPEFSTVGLAMWPAGYYLAEWILRPKSHELFNQGKTILELGAGVGLSAICLERAINKNSEAKKSKIILTDYLDTVLHNCQLNMELNSINSVLLQEDVNWSEAIKSTTSDEDKESKNQQETNVFISRLDWTNFNEQQLASLNVDVIIAADVIYDVTVVEGLVHVLSVVMENNPSAKCYIVVTKRNEKTYALFETECKKRGITSEDITRDHAPLKLSTSSQDASDSTLASMNQFAFLQTYPCHISLYSMSKK